MTDSKTVKDAINYVKQFKGMKYNKLKRPPKRDNAPFWVSNNSPPDFELVYEKGSNCAGLINLVRRYMGLPIPGNFPDKKRAEYPGGTDEWFDYLKREGRLHAIDINKTYPSGTLLLQNYNPKDQGHLAMTISKGKTLSQSKIIHNINQWYIKENNKEKMEEVYIHKFKDCPNNCRFTHICLPQDWLLKI